MNAILDPFLMAYETWWHGRSSTWDFIAAIGDCNGAARQLKCDHCQRVVYRWVDQTCQVVCERHPALFVGIEDIRTGTIPEVVVQQQAWEQFNPE